MTKDGFLHRWSRRKVKARDGIPDGEQGVLQDAEAAEQPFEDDLSPQPVRAASPQARPITDTTLEEPETLPLTLQDVQALTRDSDFSPFVSPRIEPDVKNAALRKLFSDPHYNVMDGLDTYIDDYSNMESLPTATLRRMVSAKALRMFESNAQEGDDRPAVASAQDETEPARVAEAPGNGVDDEDDRPYVIEPPHPEAPPCVAENAPRPEAERETFTDADAAQTRRSTSSR